jgi:hypothetical protein
MSVEQLGLISFYDTHSVLCFVDHEDFEVHVSKYIQEIFESVTVNF